MVHKGIFREAVKGCASGNGFEAAARAHLKSLEETGETPEQIVSQLSDVVTSYATEGLQDEANTLREIVREYQSRWIEGTRPS